MTYQKYCDDLKRFNQPITMNEKEWNSAYGIVEEYTPFLARKSSSHKNIEPTLSNHSSKSSSKPQLKINLLDIPKSSSNELLETLEKRIAEKKNPKQKAEKAAKTLTRRPNQVEKISLNGMSYEEIRAHKNQLNKERRAKDKAEGIVKVRTYEEIAKARKKSREYYHKNKEVQREKERVRRANQSAEKKQEIKEAMKKWQADNREHVNAMAREWKRKNRPKKRESLNNLSLSQKVS